MKFYKDIKKITKKFKKYGRVTRVLLDPGYSPVYYIDYREPCRLMEAWIKLRNKGVVEVPIIEKGRVNNFKTEK